MKIVQDALKSVGIPVYPAVWRAKDENQSPPDTYAVYTTMVTEAEHWDDDVRSERIYVYLNLWSVNDPTDTAARVRAAMRAAGWGMAEETTGTATSSRYNETADRYSVHWTWVRSREV